MNKLSKMIKNNEIKSEDLKDITWNETDFTWEQMDISWDEIGNILNNIGIIL